MASVQSLTQPARSALALPSSMSLVPVAASVGGAAAGYYTWKSHPYLGAVAGLAVGNAAQTLLNSPVKKDALAPLGAVAGAVAGVKYFPRKWTLVGFIAGLIAGGFVGDVAAKKL